jgi:hypothetical protein
MVLIGLILLAAAVAAGVDVAVQNHAATLTIQGAGQTATATPAEVLAGGVVCALVAVVGLLLIADGYRHRRRVRMEARTAVTQRDELAAQIDREQASRREPTTVGGPARSDLTDLHTEDTADAETTDGRPPTRRRVFSRRS